MTDEPGPEPKETDSYMIESAMEPVEEPQRTLHYARTSKDELNQLALDTPGIMPTAEDAEAELARILSGAEDGERALSDMAEAIWGLLFPYIADENGPDYGEAEMETLCADVLPKVWDLILGNE